MRLATTVLFSLLGWSALQALPQANQQNNQQNKNKKCWLHCGAPVLKTYDLGVSSVSGDQVRGPATIRADNLNVLRYNYKFSIAITFSAAPDLWAKLQAAAIPA